MAFHPSNITRRNFVQRAGLLVTALGVSGSVQSGLMDQIVKKAGRARPEITRFKGLGEMMPKVLWETTLNPRTRRLLKVEIADQIVTDRVINELMGKDPSARFRFIMDRAEEAEELDV